MDKIRVNSSVKIIEVNDNGDTIRLPLTDDSFVAQFYQTMEEIQQLSGRLSGKDNDILQAIKEVVKIDEEIRDKLDGLFGDGACRKVFGDMLPSIEMFMDFFQQLTPYVEAQAKQREANIKKYSAERTGSV